MEIRGSHKLFRETSNTFYLYNIISQSKNPIPSSPPTILFSSRRSSSVSSPSFPLFHLLRSPYSGLLGILCYGRLRLLKSSFIWSFPRFRLRSITTKVNSQVGNKDLNAFRPNATPEQVSEIVQLIRRNGDNLELDLDAMNVSLSYASIIQILGILNCEKVPALRFFNWIRSLKSEFCSNSNICSLVVHNCGGLDDYEGMLLVLNNTNSNQIRLNRKAFEFLLDLRSDETLSKVSVDKVIRIFNEVRGSCRVTGVQSLIQLFCILGSFSMAKYVMEITEIRASYYNIIIRERCRRCDFDGARDTLNEMSKSGCKPDVGIYNYLLSSLFKNDRAISAYEVLEEMQEKGCSPNALTYEIFICYLCKHNKTDFALKLLDFVVSGGIEPRITTHFAFVKGYLSSKSYDKAYDYVVHSGAKFSHSKSLIYSLLASLHEKRGEVIVARNILIELIEGGLRPDFPAYIRVFKCLQRLGREDLANELKTEYSSFSLQSVRESA